MAATWYVLYFARETEHIEGRKSACALKLRSHTGHVSSFWTAGFHESNGYLGWWSSPAFFGFSSFSLDVYYIDSSPREPRFVLVPLRFASEAWPRPGLGEPRSASNANKPASSWPLKQGRKKCSKHGCDRETSTVASGLGTHKEKKVCVDIHVQAAGSQICVQNICGQQRNSPMADPIFGSKNGPQNGVQNWITFSFLLLGLCLGPGLGSRFGPKSGVSHRKILLLPADVLQADLRRTSMSVSVNTCFFSLCVPICFLYSRGPFMAAMFLVFWILFSGP